MNLFLNILIAAIATLAAGYAIRCSRQILVLHQQINSRMDEWIIAVGQKASAEGRALGIAVERGEERERA